MSVTQDLGDRLLNTRGEENNNKSLVSFWEPISLAHCTKYPTHRKMSNGKGRQITINEDNDENGPFLLIMSSIMTPSWFRGQRAA